jgi:O-antigen ligase
MLIFSPSSPLQRMLHPDYADYLGSQVRREFWSEGIDMIVNHPITGIGLGNFTQESVSEVVKGLKGIACNTFLEIAAELGIPGLIAYCAVLIGTLVSAAKLRRRGQESGDIRLVYVGHAMQAGLLGFAAAAIFVSAEYQKPFWIMTALTATVPTLLRDISDQSVLVPEDEGSSLPSGEICGSIDDNRWAPERGLLAHAD